MLAGFLTAAKDPNKAVTLGNHVLFLEGLPGVAERALLAFQFSRCGKAAPVALALPLIHAGAARG